MRRVTFPRRYYPIEWVAAIEKGLVRKFLHLLALSFPRQRIIGESEPRAIAQRKRRSRVYSPVEEQGPTFLQHKGRFLQPGE